MPYANTYTKKKCRKSYKTDINTQTAHIKQPKIARASPGHKKSDYDKTTFHSAPSFLLA